MLGAREGDGDAVAAGFGEAALGVGGSLMKVRAARMPRRKFSSRGLAEEAVRVGEGEKLREPRLGAAVALGGLGLGAAAARRPG